MGMAASQARYLALAARKSNLEYQGQQINNERTILSQQCTDLYNSLLAMSVPTPPSTQDFTKIVYSGTDGNLDFKLGIIKPSGELYNVELQEKAYGRSLQTNYGSSVVGRTTISVQVDSVNLPIALKNLSEEELSKYYVVNKDGIEQLSKNSSYVHSESDGTYTLTINNDDVESVFKENSDGNSCIQYEDPNGSITIQGKEAMTFEEAKAKYGDTFDDGKYEEAIRNTFPQDGNNTITKDDFYVFATQNEKGVIEFEFALKDDVHSPDGFCQTYSFIPNGQFNTSATYDQCKLEFDASGRITAIYLPITDSDGTILKYKKSELSAASVVDDAAYNDAYAKYEYAMYEYDKKNAEINAKTEVIQQEDKNLELKLQRLDNERDAIAKEMEALDKVIGDNIEGTFKTFAG